MFVMVKGSCAAPKATCGWPHLPSNRIRTHLWERYDCGSKPLTADMYTVYSTKTTHGCTLGLGSLHHSGITSSHRWVFCFIGFFSPVCCFFFWGGGAHGYLVKHDPRLFLASPVWLFDFNTWQDWHYLIYSPHKCVLLCTLRHTEGGSSPTQDTLPQEVDDVCYCPMLNGWQVVRNRAGSDRVYEEQENRKKKTSKIRK